MKLEKLFATLPIHKLNELRFQFGPIIVQTQVPFPFIFTTTVFLVFIDFTPNCILCLLYIYSCRVNDTHLVTLRMPRCSMTWSERARSRPREFANKKPSRMAGSGWFNVKGPYISEIRWSSLLVIPPMMFLCLFCGSASRLQVMFFLATKFQMRKKPGDWTINAPFRLGRGFLHRPLTLGCKLQANIVTNIIYWVRTC